MKLIITAASAGLFLFLGTSAFAQSDAGYLPAGNVVCANPEKLADLPHIADWRHDTSELPKGCDAVEDNIPLRNARLAGKVICFELVADRDTRVCTHAASVKNR
jgi:hypothetical protein